MRRKLLETLKRKAKKKSRRRIERDLAFDRATRQVNAPVAIRFEARQGDWVVLGSTGRKFVFSTKMDAENYCIKILKYAAPVLAPPDTRHQELPHGSVWTGAPWDRSFATAPRTRSRDHERW